VKKEGSPFVSHFNHSGMIIDIRQILTPTRKKIHKKSIKMGEKMIGRIFPGRASLGSSMGSL
jgi:hypothetical protein